VDGIVLGPHIHDKKPEKLVFTMQSYLVKIKIKITWKFT